MRLIKSVCATDVLGDVADSTENEMERNKIQSLLESLIDNGKVKDFEWYIENEFPNGTDIDELVSFCTSHTIEYIFDGMNN